ncbi:DUF3025 domain-containing protein [Sulfuriferula nivalis]|uniref:Transmembrane protein n=1 Tax=Sulfuriferula nivalis TaxID=2675298 RepID=A0A809RR86_9PROT|nr:DUF3025 domain-containing protein [Sulfuriferula nivalis]BBP01381.1 hypothetical protein SFSGTM_20890 [Sulfuriferula nivalis]
MPTINSDWLHSSPLYAPLSCLPNALTQTCDIALLNDYARSQNICNALGTTIQFVNCTSEVAYETHINTTGAIPTRTDNWHDYFNALAWLIWPHTKATLNALHIRAGVTPLRNRSRDALTLLDESGIIVACSTPELWQTLTQHQWYELFVNQRQRVKTDIAFHLIGHALYEKLLNPYPGITGKCQLVEVDKAFFQLDTCARQRQLDQQLAQQLNAEPPLTPKTFPPLPVFGIPDTIAENCEPAYYQNTQIFR